MSNTEPKPSEVVRSSSGRQYHTDLAPGDLADYILLIVDPARVARVVNYLDEVTLERANREFRSYTGRYRGVPISVICTGIGQDNTEMVFVEALLVSTGRRPAMIRVGSCGGLRQEVALGDLVISTGAVRLESTSTYFVDEGYPAVPHYEVTMALIAAADQTGQPYHVGLNASAAGFYGAQGREVAGLKPKNPGIAEQLAAWNVLNMEMESSTLFTLGNLSGVRTGMVGVVYSNRARGEFIDDETRLAGDLAAERVGLEAVRYLAQIDSWKVQNQKEFFVPQFSGDVQGNSA